MIPCDSVTYINLFRVHSLHFFFFILPLLTLLLPSAKNIKCNYDILRINIVQMAC